MLHVRLRVRLFAVLALVSLMLVGAAIASAASPVTIQLTAENDSGENGTATLTDLGNRKTMIDVAITGEAADGSQPMHVHAGQCGPTLGKVVFPLTNLEGGKSSTTIDSSLDALMTGGFAINGHKSKAEIGVYVYCGNIPAAAAAALPTTGGDPFSNILLMSVMGLVLFVGGFVVFRAAPRAR